MPKFPIVSGVYLMKFLESQWFVFKRSVGSHFVYTHDWITPKITTVVPKHKQLDIGTLKWILKQAHIDSEIFLTWLKDN
jgi:predicted RNA binding protein YcfA (HicA-like mRNA interferase family)